MDFEVFAVETMQAQKSSTTEAVAFRALYQTLNQRSMSR
jgi:hypothetical protein